MTEAVEYKPESQPYKASVDIRVILSDGQKFNTNVEYYPTLGGTCEKAIDSLRQLYPRLADAQITIVRSYDIYKSKIFD